ncbi:MAG: DUF3866 family protein [Acidimicrobiia bacterium]|nr:DUF3866 family protein [Acidimicrobiia bacterium]
MPSFHTGRVSEIISERRGLQRVRVVLDGAGESSAAVNYPDLIGSVEVGDEVVCNTTAVDLGLGTGGWHVVHWVNGRREFSSLSGGHIMKLRYTSLQTDVLVASEAASPLHTHMQEEHLGGMPVVAASLHSQLAAVTAGIRASSAGGDLVVAYVMTDGAALPLALSDLCADLTAAGFVDMTVTAGHAFGGDLEAVTVASALLAARHAGADVAVVAMGPGIVGTGLSTATTAREVSHVLTETAALGGVPIACLRCSDADSRTRHRGISHHSLESLRATPPLDPLAEIVLPQGDPVREAAMREQLTTLEGVHSIVTADPGAALSLLDAGGIEPTSMGRPVSADPVFWLTAAAAGAHAAAATRAPTRARRQQT